MRLEELGLIGNCQCSALVHRNGSVAWCCLPRFDSEPVFGGLLDEAGGEFSISPASGDFGQQRYLPNSNILQLEFPAPDGRFHSAADRLRDQILDKAWSERRTSFVGDYGGDALDAALLQMAPLRFLPAHDPIRAAFAASPRWTEIL